MKPQSNEERVAHIFSYLAGINKIAENDESHVPLSCIATR